MVPDRSVALSAAERARAYWQYLAAWRRQDREELERLQPLALADAKLRQLLRRALRDQTGAVAIETLFFLLIFLVSFFGAVELGQGIAVKQSLDLGVYRAARYLSLAPEDWDTATAIVREEVGRSVLGGNPQAVTVTIEMPDTSFSTPFSVRAEYPFQATVPLVPGLSGRTLVSEHGMRIERYP
jgi:Flp pilus assembly protein TadG